MSNYSKKISELVSTGKVPESAVIPVALAGQINETYRVSLNDVRANLLFENAYTSIANGISNTIKDEIFYVYTDDTQHYVAAFVNVNGASATALYKNGTPVIFGTGKLIGGGQFGAYTSYVSYVYNNGSAVGGETEITIPFDCFDIGEMFLNGGHQIKGFNYTFDNVTNKVKLGGPLSAGATVVLYTRPYPGTPVTPVEPGITDYVNVSWLYNDGAAVGGETTLTPPWSFKTVTAIYINGSRQILNKHFEIANSTTISLAKALSKNDIVEVILGGSRAEITVSVSGTPAEVLSTLALSTGATKVNTSYGINLDQVAQGFYGVESFDALRSRKPAFEGEKIYLKGYYSGSVSGAGYFIGHLAAGVDDGGSIASGTGYYWERIVINNEINLANYGVIAGSDITNALTAAVAFSRLKNITLITIPPSNTMYTFYGSVAVDVTKCPLHIRGGDGTGMDSVQLNHKFKTGGETYGIKFFNTVAGAPCWNPGKLSGIYAYCTDTVNPLHFVRFADGWGNELKNFHAHGYVLSAAVVVCNEISWTENFYAENLNIRHCLQGILFYSKSAWQSFYGTTVKRYYFNFGSGVGKASKAVVLGGGNNVDRAFMYSSHFDVGGWIGTTYANDPQIIFYVRAYSGFVQGEVQTRFDGLKQSNFGTLVRTFVTETLNSCVDVRWQNDDNQFGYTDGVLIVPTAGSVNSYPAWDNLAYPTSDGSAYTYGRCNYGNSPYGARCPIQTKGARICYRTSLTSTATATTDNGIIRITNLPVNSTFKVEIRINGSNHVNSRAYTVSTQGQSYVASVIEHEKLKAETTLSNSVYTTTLSPYSSFTTNTIYAQTYMGMQAGYFSANNGQCFDIVIPPALYRGTSQNTDTAVAGNVYGIEIEITQL